MQANSEQGGEQMPMPVRFDTQKREQVGGAAGRTRAILETARASSKPCTGKLWSRKSEREASEIGSAALRPLHARSLLLPRPPPFIGQEGAVRH